MSSYLYAKDRKVYLANSVEGNHCLTTGNINFALTKIVVGSVLSARTREFLAMPGVTEWDG